MAGLTQVLPLERYSLATDLAIAGAPTEDAATVCAPRRRPSNISFVLTIVMALITATRNQTTDQIVQEPEESHSEDKIFILPIAHAVRLQSVGNRGQRASRYIKSYHPRLQGSVNRRSGLDLGLPITSINIYDNRKLLSLKTHLDPILGSAWFRVRPGRQPYFACSPSLQFVRPA